MAVNVQNKAAKPTVENVIYKDPVNTNYVQNCAVISPSASAAGHDGDAVVLKLCYR